MNHLHDAWKGSSAGGFFGWLSYDDDDDDDDDDDNDDGGGGGDDHDNGDGISSSLEQWLEEKISSVVKGTLALLGNQDMSKGVP